MLVRALKEVDYTKAGRRLGVAALFLANLVSVALLVHSVEYTLASQQSLGLALASPDLESGMAS